MKRLVSFLLVFCLLISASPVVHAYSGPAASSNIDEHYYINGGRWTDPIKSTLAREGSGYTRVECIGDRIIVEQYNSNLQYVSGQEIALELPIYGGVYICDDYNFVVVGQNNTEEDDSKEVFRIIRYSKDWVRQASCGLYGANTIEPFQAGCVRFDRCGDYLYIRTSHKMYASEDGTNHQANVMINVRISDMTVTDELTEILNRNYGYISHSFNQFVRVDGTDLLAVDHGDALPRSVVLIKYNNPAGQDNFYGKVTYVNALPIMDSANHYNDTGVSVGGFEFSSSNYLIAGSGYNGTEEIDLMYAHRNIFVTATPKNNFTDEATTVHWLTNYSANDNVDVSPPHLVKIENDRFFLVWTENGVLKYCFIDGKGQLDSSIQTGKGALSDCVPILDGERVLWYVTDNSAPVFYHINLSGSNEEPHTHSYTAVVTAPTCTQDGFTTYTCSCGDSYTGDTVAATGHSWSSWSQTKAPTCENAGQEQRTCSVCNATESNPVAALGHSYTSVVTAPSCTQDGFTTYTCSRCSDSYTGDTVVATGHSWDDGVVTKEATEEENGIITYTCKTCSETRTEEFEYEPTEPEPTEPEPTEPEPTEPEPTEPEPTEPEPTEPEPTEPDEPETEIIRISGSGRCETAIEIADMMKETLGLESFDAIIIANGDNFADALAGSYLASQKNAPILLYRASAVEMNLEYIQKNLAADGTVYLLGGDSAVPADVEEGLKAAGITVERLSGKSRFDTNLEILREAGIEAGQEILVATGYNFADSLSASATGLPILMVNNGLGELTEAQIAFLETLEGCTFTVIGGDSAVSDDLMDAIGAYGDVTRLSGKNREATSVLVAETYFKDPDCVVLAYSRNFPDGLCGGPLAYALGAPLILTNAGQEAVAAEYIAENGITKGLVLGGNSAVSEATVNVIFNQS